MLYQAIVHNTHHLSSIRRLNDPFDCRARFHLATTTIEDVKSLFVDEVTHPSGDAITRHNALSLIDNSCISARECALIINDQLDQILEETYILSFSESPKSLAMWSHYGDSHSGLCFQIDLSVIHSPAKPIFPAIYHNLPPRLKRLDNAQTKFTIIESIIRTKSIDWRNEREWRIVYIQPKCCLIDGRAPLKLPDNCLRGVLLGCQIDPKIQSIVIDMCRSSVSNSSICIRKMIPANNSFRLQSEIIETVCN